MPRKVSGYISVFNDWDILPRALESAAPYIDELVVVDGGYGWMDGFLTGIGKDSEKSEQPVYDCLEASGLDYRVIRGVWKDEFEKRKAGYLACRHQYIFRIDADEIFFINEQNLETFLSQGAAVGEGEFPLYIAPGFLLTSRTSGLERTSFFFDSAQVSADDHLHYLWLIDDLPQQRTDHPAVFGPPLSTTAHLTNWRTPRTGINRAGFYVLNYFRHHGVSWYPDLSNNPLDDLSPLFARIPPAAFLDILNGHKIVVGDEQLNGRVLRPSTLTANQEACFAPLFQAFLDSQAERNAAFAIRPSYALGEVHLDVTSPAAADALSTGGQLVLTCDTALAAAEAHVRYLIPQEPWEIIRKSTIELDGPTVRIDLPFGRSEPEFVRRFVRFEGWAASGVPLLRYARTGIVANATRVRVETVPGKPEASEMDAQPLLSPPETAAPDAGSPESERDEAKIRYLRQVRRDYIDPLTSHPLYRDFTELLDQHETETHYPRFALTMAELSNTLGDLLSRPEKPVICETGALSLISQFFLDRGYRVTGTESDLRYCIDAPSAAFDLVFSLEVIAHLKDQREENLDDLLLFQGSGVRQYVDEIWRILKPGGLIVMTTPNPSSLSALLSVVNYEPPMIYRPHIREYTKAELLELFAKFELVRYTTFFAYANLGHGPELARDYARQLAWNPDDRGDCHFFVFRK